MHILLVDDHSLFRRGLKFLLADLEESITFFEAQSIQEIAKHRDQDIHLVLLDLNLPGAEGLSGLAAVREIFPDSVTVILSGHEDPRFIISAIAAGAAGFIPKCSTPEIMVSALRLVLAGGVYLPPLSLEAMDDIDQPQRLGTVAEGSHHKDPMSGQKPRLEGLTERQLQALELAVKGLANKVIARDLGVSEGTVKQHLGVAFQVLGVSNRTEAVYALAASRETLRSKA
jgi:DNA-binding NarL/FixJ family response regulator